MRAIPPGPAISAYQLFIINKIIPDLESSREFSLYKLVEKAVSSKCILPSSNALIMETFYAVKEYLLAEGAILEKQEMTSYTLTDTGKKLAACKTIEAFIKWKNTQRKKTILHRLLIVNMDKILFSKKKEQLIEYYE